MLAEALRDGRKPGCEQPDGVAAHDRADVVLGQPLGQQRLGEQRHPGRIERRRDGAIEIGAKPDVLDAGQLDRADDRPADRGDVVATGGDRPEPDADQPAGRGDPADLVVGEVPDSRAAARTPVCDATIGRTAIDRMSSIVADDACATSMITPLASMRDRRSRPAGVNPPLTMPCAEPPYAVSKK